MKENHEIFEQLRKQPFSLRNFIREHLNGILGTIIFHMLLLIVFLLVKIHQFRETTPGDLLIEFKEEPVAEEIIPEEEGETEEEYYERLLEQQLRQSNRAVNEANNIEDEISTKNYVEDVMEDLEKNRSEDWLKQQKELEKVLSAEDVVPQNPDPEEKQDNQEYHGPTNITYAFSEPPYKRGKIKLPVPVYRCRGSGTVEVNINVDRMGYVTSAKSKVISATDDPDCLANVAETYARRSVFQGDLSAPASQQGTIRYQFIAQ